MSSAAHRLAQMRTESDSSVPRPRKYVEVIDSDFFGEKWQRGVQGSFKKEKEEKGLQRQAEVTILGSFAVNRGRRWSKAGEEKKGPTRF